MQLNSKYTRMLHIPLFWSQSHDIQWELRRRSESLIEELFFVSHSDIAEIEESGKFSKLFHFSNAHTTGMTTASEHANRNSENRRSVVCPFHLWVLPLPSGYLYLCFSVLSIISHWWSCASIHRLYNIAAREEGTRQVDNIARNELVVRFAHFSPIANVHIFNLFIFIQLSCVCAVCTRNDVEHFQYSHCIQRALACCSHADFGCCHSLSCAGRFFNFYYNLYLYHSSITTLHTTDSTESGAIMWIPG